MGLTPEQTSAIKTILEFVQEARLLTKIDAKAFQMLVEEVALTRGWRCPLNTYDNPCKIKLTGEERTYNFPVDPCGRYKRCINKLIRYYRNEAKLELDKETRL